jgi:ketosteroid isomerase-like protein
MTHHLPPAARATTVAREFVRAVEAKDLDGVAATLHPGARQLFLHTRATTSAEGIAALIDGRRRGLCVADLKGSRDVLAYTEALFRKFTPLAWSDHAWSVSSRGEVFFQGTGAMALTRDGTPYRNRYLTRFDVVDGKIVLMAEYANAFRYARLRVRPNAAEFRGLIRAIGGLVTPTPSAPTGTQTAGPAE